jgi:hypothetical protein
MTWRKDRAESFERLLLLALLATADLGFDGVTRRPHGPRLIRAFVGVRAMVFGSGEWIDDEEWA